jgi:hypothetical protein
MAAHAAVRLEMGFSPFDISRWSFRATSLLLSLNRYN